MEMNLIKTKKRKGFTLIELIVVIAIIGILAAIAIPRLTGFQNSAKVAADKATFKTLTNAVAMGVTDGTITTTATATSVAGAITSTSPANLLEAGAAFKVGGNAALTLTWTVTNGVITKAPTIADATGVITPAP